MKLQYNGLSGFHRLVGSKLGLFAQDISTLFRRSVRSYGSAVRGQSSSFKVKVAAVISVVAALLLAASLMMVFKGPGQQSPQSAWLGTAPPPGKVLPDANGRAAVTPDPARPANSSAPAPAGKGQPQSGTQNQPAQVFKTPAAWPAPSAAEKAWDSTRAMQEYSNIIQTQPGTAQAADTELRLGALYLQNNNYDGALWIIGSFADTHASDPRRPDATLLLAAAHRGKGEWQQALDVYLQYPLDGSPLGGYVKFQIADMYARLSHPDKAQEWYYQAAADEPPLKNKIDSLEEMATASLKGLDVASVLKDYQAILDVAKSRTYRATVMFRMGMLQRSSGAADQGNEVLRQIVQSYGETPSAIQATNVLQQVAPGLVSLRDTAMVHYLNKDYQTAVALFGGYLSGDSVSEQAAEVHYLRGLAYEQLQDTASAMTQYNALVSLVPNSPYAGNASLRIGTLLYLGGDVDGALNAWRRAADKATDTTVKGEAMYWIGKTLTDRGQTADAKPYLDGAVANSTSGYVVGRALAIESNTATVQPDSTDTPGMYDASKLSGDPATERAGLEKWIASWANLDSYLVVDGRLQSRLQSDPGFLRASRLLEIGLRDEAIADFKNLTAQLSDQPLAQVDLATYLAGQGLYSQSIDAAMAVQIESPVANIEQAPRMLQRLAYPAPFSDAVVEQCKEKGIDPLLLLSVMRQESYFNPQATSSAAAIGLMQVMPGTGAQIAASLGHSDFQPDDLYSADVSIEYGAWYIAEQLRYYGNNMYYALGAYNAGPGNVNSWIRGGVSDIDRWVQTIPLSETRNYVQRIYGYYQAYKAIYRSGLK